MYCNTLWDTKTFSSVFNEVVFNYYVSYILACCDWEHKNFKENLKRAYQWTFLSISLKVNLSPMMWVFVGYLIYPIQL